MEPQSESVDLAVRIHLRVPSHRQTFFRWNIHRETSSPSVYQLGMISSWLQEPATLAYLALLRDRADARSRTDEEGDFLASRCWEREKNDFGNGRHSPLIYRTRYCGDTSF